LAALDNDRPTGAELSQGPADFNAIRQSEQFLDSIVGFFLHYHQIYIAASVLYGNTTNPTSSL
jgi:hypothetical protein